MSFFHQLPSAGTLARLVFYAVFASLFLWYALFQARLLIAGPSLELDSLAVTHSERVAVISGTAHNVSSLSLNGRPIFTNDEGYFHESVVLERGYTIMTLRAEDRYGRTAEVTHPLVYAPAFTHR